MCKYINFNNLRKKKGFAGGGVVVGWSSPLWKYKKRLRKHKKKEEKIRKTIYYLNSEKIMKISFYCSKKSGFWEHGKHKKQKYIIFFQTSFLCFLFLRTENSSWKSNQTGHKYLLILHKTMYRRNGSANGKNIFTIVLIIDMFFYFALIWAHLAFSSAIKLWKEHKCRGQSANTGKQKGFQYFCTNSPLNNERLSSFCCTFVTCL